ncbi:MAG: CDP-glycerol glycerophosphotransferase family protein [Oscillospiraceae bacterium]|jgi:CDP-ribitol ribitolphosphotransferase|nr:CDP-glycerol glycerophosphotransferase family protein [Oscillospiraceae bacterium]
MKDALFAVLIALTRAAYWVLRHLLPAQDSVLFLSRQSDTSSVDFSLLQEELKRQAPQLRQRVFCRRMDGESITDLLWLIKPTFAMLTARGCFVDGQCVPLSLYEQREGFIAVQVWHALGALKKFGWQAVGMPDGRAPTEAKRWNMHAHYTFSPCASRTTQSVYCEAFGYSAEQVPILGMPRVDEILRIINNKNVRNKIYAAHPTWEQMFKILYAPTFRKGVPLNIKPLLHVLSPELRKKYKLIVKVHPNDEKPDSPGDVAQTSIPTHELFAVADVIITDYSAAAVEASLAGKPLYFYVPDLEQYSQSNGLNIHLEDELHGAVFSNFAQLMEAIEAGNYDFAQLARFCEKYVSTADTENTYRIVKEFLSRLNARE